MRNTIAILATAAAALSFAAAPATAQCEGSRARAQQTSHPVQTQTRGDIVDVASQAGAFNTLLAAAQAAGLVDTLRSDGPFTVFAPTDAAFAALPHGTVERLLRPENRPALQALLTYHVVPGRITSDQLAGRTAAPATVNGAILAIDGRDGVQVNNANVITADVAASNGVIHVIDTVLMPF
jgi:uncharacterized surface protein with fasciclin (FAS1) repeats